MKISAKVKIIAIGIVVILILSGIGIMLWHHQQPKQAIPESTINQTAQKASAVSSAKSISSKKNISDEQIKKTKDNQNEDAQKTQAIAFLDSLEKNGQEKATANVSKEEKKAELYKALMHILPVYRELDVYRHNTGKEIESLMNDSLDRERINNGNVNRIQFGITSEGRTEIIPFNKQGQRIINDPYLDAFMSAIREKEDIVIATNIRLRAVFQEIDALYPGAVKYWEDATLTGSPGYVVDNVLREYLGKELPWDGNTDYKNAKDFTP